MATNVATCPSITGGLIGKSEKKHRLKQRFEVVRKLGQGTYGKVQLAINKETGQEVAIKTIKKSKIENEKDLTRIRREIQIMSSIQHPNIIHIFEVFENKDKIVLVMQFARGGELYEYVSQRKKLSDNEARRIFRQIATAIYYCHKNKVCHRDLKLENILLDDKGNAKIGDFGLSNVFDLRNNLNTFCGSALYASPEIVKGTPYIGPEVDCWSLGVLLYTLVYGAMPFDGSNYKSLVKLISEAKYFEPKSKSDASHLIRKLLSVQPNKRATIIDICTDDWVNKGEQRCLLQVAEDLANLTPVKIEILLALAPIPQSDSQTSVTETEKKKLSTTEEPKVTVLEPDDQASAVKRRKSTKKSVDGKKSKDKENESSKSKSIKLKDDNNNLDAEKQKFKSSQQSKISLNQDSDYVSEEPVSLSKKSDTDRESRSTVNQSIGDLNDNQQSGTIKSDVAVSRKPSVKGVLQKQVSVNSSDKLKSVEQSKEPIKKTEELVSSSSISLVRKPSTKSKTTKTTAPINKETSKEPIKDVSKDNLKESPKESSKESSKEETEVISSNKKSFITQQSIETDKTEDDQSTSKDITCVGPVRTQSKIGDAKRMFEKPRRQESIEREKQERIILLNKVSDVKNKFERRASVNAANAQPWNKPSGERKKSIADSSDSPTIPKVVAVVPVTPATTPKAASEQTTIKESPPKASPPIPTSTSSANIKEEVIKPITTTSISTIKPKLIERQVSVSSSTNNPPTGNDRSNLKVRRHTVKAKTNSTTAVATIAELKRKDLFAIKEKQNALSPVETIKENEINRPQTPTPASPTLLKTTSLLHHTEHPSIPPAHLTSAQTIRSLTPTDNQSTTQSINSVPQFSPITSPIDKPKLKILNTTAPSQPISSGSALNCNQSTSFIVQSPSIKSTNSQDSISGSTLNSASASKLAPIARSYKKISFTKDGATITETGRIISEETPSGTKVTKKIVTKKSTTPGLHEGSSASIRNHQSFDSETDDFTSSFNDHHNRIKSRSNNLMNAHSNSSNLSSNIGSSGVRKSDSTSSSGSVDILEDIFDSWVGDNPMFNNISSKFKSLFNQPSSSLFGNNSFGRNSKANFPSFLNRSKPSLAKNRAESCERRGAEEGQPGTPSTGGVLFRRPGYSTEGESDTDEDLNGQNVGLWKFLNPNITSRLLNKHPSLMNGMDFFNNNNEDSMVGRSSRDRFKGFDSKPPTFLPNRFKSASRDLITDSPNDAVFKTTFTIKPNGSTRIVTTTSRNNSGTNLTGPTTANIQMFPKNMTSSIPVNRFVERMNLEQPMDYGVNNQQVFEFEPEMNSDFKTNFPITIGRLRPQNSQINSPLPNAQACNAPRTFNRSTSARIDNPRSFMDTSNYRGIKVHEIPIEQETMTSNTKEHYIPIVRQSSNEQPETNNNSLLDQLKTHGYRSLVNQRSSKLDLNNFSVPTSAVIDEQTNGSTSNKAKRGKNASPIESHDRMYKSLITNTEEIDTMNSDLIHAYSVNHLNEDYLNTINHFVSDSHVAKKQNHSKFELKSNFKSNQLTNGNEKFDYKGLMNVARDCLGSRMKTNKLTEKYSSLSSKSLEHLNDLIKPSLFKHISLSTQTDEKFEVKEKKDEIVAYGSDEDDVKLKQKFVLENRKTNNETNECMLRQNKKHIRPIPRTRTTKSNKSKTIENGHSNEEDENATLSSTDSVIQSLNSSSTTISTSNRLQYCKEEELNDLKDDYLNCSINNQVNQIQQLIQLLYAENGDEEEKNREKNGSTDKNEKDRFKQDNYQLLRKTQSDLKELKNDLQILQMKNKLKRRLTEQKSIPKKVQNERDTYSSMMSIDTSGSNTLTPTSDEDSEESARKSSKSYTHHHHSLPPLPPVSIQSTTDKTKFLLHHNKHVRPVEAKRLNDRLNYLNDNLINQSNKRMMDECCLTDNDHSNDVPHSLISSQEHALSTNKNVTSSNIYASPSIRSASSMNGYQSAYLNGHSKSFNNNINNNHNNKSINNSNNINGDSIPSAQKSNGVELTRRSTIGSSTETVQERILRKSFYSRFQSPDRTASSLDNQKASSQRIRRKSSLSSSGYLDDDLDDTKRIGSKSILKSNSANTDEDDISMNGSINEPMGNRSTYSRRTAHSPYRNKRDYTEDLSDDDELLKSLSSINRRNSFAYGTSNTNRFPSLQASFERNLNNNNDIQTNKNYSSTKLLNESVSKRNSIAHIDYDNNNNLFRNGLNSMRNKLNDSNGLIRVTSNLSDLSSFKTDQRKNLKKPNELTSRSSYGLNLYSNLEHSP